MIYNPMQVGPYKVAGYHDPDRIRKMGLIFRPPTWAAGTVYYKQDDDNYDVVIPATFTGLYYKVKAPGKSHASTEPTWSYVAGEETTDGTTGLIWEGVNYNLLPPGIDVSSVTFEATHSMTISTFTNTATSVDFTIPVISAAAEAAGYFDVTAHVVFSNTEKDDVTLRFKVAER
jgi:hypothetical protein